MESVSRPSPLPGFHFFCINCRFYDPADDLPVSRAMGYCHRHAPKQYYEGQTYLWPQVSETAFCGEGEPDPDWDGWDIFLG